MRGATILVPIMKTNRALFVLKLASLLMALATCSALGAPLKFSWDFEQAVRAGNVEDAKKILSQNPDWVNNYRFNLNPPLVEAAQDGKLEIVALLVTNHADINAHGAWGRTALQFAANNGDAKIVEYLLKHNADPNSRDQGNLTPIIQSIKSVEVIRLLLAYGADINAHGGANTLYAQAIENPQSVGEGVIPFHS